MSDETKMRADEVLDELRCLGWPDSNDRDVSTGPATFKRIYNAVAAMIEREAALVHACAVKDRVGIALTAARNELLSINAVLSADRDAQAKRIAELEADARRWRLARMMIPPESIDIEESERANEGEFLSELEACQSDATIDRILKLMADDDARAEARDG